MLAALRRAADIARERKRLGPLLECFVHGERARTGALPGETMTFSHYRDKDGVESIWSSNAVRARLSGSRSRLPRRRGSGTSGYWCASGRQRVTGSPAASFFTTESAFSRRHPDCWNARQDARGSPREGETPGLTATGPVCFVSRKLRSSERGGSRKTRHCGPENPAPPELRREAQSARDANSQPCRDSRAQCNRRQGKRARALVSTVLATTGRHHAVSCPAGWSRGERGTPALTAHHRCKEDGADHRTTEHDRCHRQRRTIM